MFPTTHNHLSPANHITANRLSINDGSSGTTQTPTKKKNKHDDLCVFIHSLELLDQKNKKKTRSVQSWPIVLHFFAPSTITSKCVRARCRLQRTHQLDIQIDLLAHQHMHKSHVYQRLSSQIQYISHTHTHT